MRKVIYSQMVSLDGFIEADESYQGLNWAVSDEELSRHFIDHENTIDAHLYGRRIYENLATWWPKAANDPSIPTYLAEYGRIWVNKPKIVFSNLGRGKPMFPALATVLRLELVASQTFRCGVVLLRYSNRDEHR